MSATTTHSPPSIDGLRSRFPRDKGRHAANDRQRAIPVNRECAQVAKGTVGEIEETIEAAYRHRNDNPDPAGELWREGIFQLSRQRPRAGVGRGVFRAPCDVGTAARWKYFSCSIPMAFLYTVKRCSTALVVSSVVPPVSLVASPAISLAEMNCTNIAIQLL
jgi:hypothetical protein